LLFKIIFSKNAASDSQTEAALILYQAGFIQNFITDRTQTYAKQDASCKAADYMKQEKREVRSRLY